ncbi:MAG: hypothetical protein ABSE89_07405 [Sedimentisphaerales bacterium]
MSNYFGNWPFIIAQLIAILSGILALVLSVIGPIQKDKETKPHRWVRVFTISAVLMGLASIYLLFYDMVEKQDQAIKATNDVNNILHKIEQESLRLSPLDFQIRLVFYTTSGERGNPNFSVKPVHVTGSLGSASFIFDFVDVGAYQQLRAGRGGGGRWGVRYYATNLTFIDLEKYPFLYNLNGTNFKFSVPLLLDKDKFESTDWENQVDLYIKGRHFRGNIDQQGNVKISINIPSFPN